ncbi:MAG: prenyltransferase/squalene oxidase repeat-containing protein [Isosphaeraceae bacterium]
MLALLLPILAWQVPPAPESRALAFLAREVPAWSKANRCFSCHNNGDAARALIEASSRPEFRTLAPESALADTLDWLKHPDRWDEKADGEFHDRRLVSIAFSQALAAATRVNLIEDRGPLRQAAQRLARIQAADGSFPIDGPDTVGAPATYGRPLATAMALRTLQAADPMEFDGGIRRGLEWLRIRPIRNTLDASAVLIADPGSSRADEARKRLRDWQGEDGGWGPYPNSPPEVFDTAIASLATGDQTDEDRLVRQRARAFLIRSQKVDGSWPETTRPPGGVSYAERLATAGWATLALLDTSRASDKRPPSESKPTPLRYRSGLIPLKETSHPEPTRPERSTP